MVSEQAYMSARKWSLRVAIGHPFLAVWELNEAPRVPVREHITPFNTAYHLPVARGGTPVSLQELFERPATDIHKILTKI
jgi:hypothetical protein